MPRGGARVGAGRPRKNRVPNAGNSEPRGDIPPIEPISPEIPGELVIEAPATEQIVAGSESPLAFMLRVMNDPAADSSLRARMAVAAAPYLHPKAEVPGKKEDRQEAAGRVGKGRLATPATPLRLIVSNKA